MPFTRVNRKTGVFVTKKFSKGVCNHCGYIGCRKALELHIRVSHGSTLTKMFMCIFCGEKFSTQKEQNEHKVFAHRAEIRKSVERGNARF